MKKYFFQILVLASIFSMHSYIAASADVVNNQENAVIALVDDSGKDRIANIMSQIKHDAVPGKANPISYVQVSNLDKDLNIKEIAHYFDCKTVMGNAFLIETLQRPVSPIDQSGIVELRAKVIKELVENPQFKQQIEQILQNAVEQEKIAMQLMTNTFKNSTCPEFENLKKMKEQKHWLYGYCNFIITNSTFRTYSMVMDFVNLPQDIALPIVLGSMAFNNEYRLKCLGTLNSFGKNLGLGPIDLSPGFCAKASGYLAVTTALGMYALYSSCVKAGEKRVKMHALNQLVNAAESIEQLLNQYYISSQFSMNLITDEQGIYLIDGLKASRYKNATDYCFNTAAVHTFLYKIYEKDAQLAQIFASIAEMDAYNAIADKILEGQDNNHKFCFAQKMESSKPEVSSTEFWNVLVPNAVVNDMCMNNHIILTGPNAGGKTTSIRANLQNIVLAQTYGIAAAEKFEYTQFDVILSYLNISDDLMNGLSLFASEIKRAKDLLEIIKELKPGQKLFFALDELFTGTAAEQGEKCAYEFIKKAASFDQVLFIYATHFDKLKELGKQNIGLMNYKVDAPIKNKDGKLVYPFTLSVGASTINIAEDMAKEAGLFE